MFACQKALQGSDDLGKPKDPGRCTIGLGMGASWLRKHLLTLSTKTLLEQPSARPGVLCGTHPLGPSRHSSAEGGGWVRPARRASGPRLTQSRTGSCSLLKDSCTFPIQSTRLSSPTWWASGVGDAALDPVHPLLGTLSILGTEVVHTFAGLELQNQMRTRDEGGLF